MPILTDFSPADITSIIVAVISAFICLAALVTALVIGFLDSRHRFEMVIEECLSPISIFIEDSFWVIAEGKFRDTNYIEEGEKKLVEGLHRLQVFALTNNYEYLGQLAKISYGEKEIDKNKQCFSFCLLTLEDIYLKYRQEKVSGVVTEEEKKRLHNINFLFQRFLRLLSKYMFGFQSKYFFRKDEYYKELEDLYNDCEKYEPKSE